MAADSGGARTAADAAASLAAGGCTGLALSLGLLGSTITLLACAAALHLIARQAASRRALAVFGAWAAGFVAGGTHWIGLAIYRPPANGLGDTALLVTVLLGFHAALYVLCFTALRRVASPAGMPLAACIAAAWTCAEVLRGMGPWAMPWGALGGSQVDNPLLKGLYPIIGSPGVAGATWLLAGGLRAALVCAHRRLARDGGAAAPAAARSRGTLRVAAGAAAVGLSAASQGIGWTTPLPSPLHVRLVHTHWPEETKYLPDSQLAALAQLLGSAQDTTGADLVVFPELFIAQPPSALPSPFRREVLQASERSHTALLFGAPGQALLEDGEVRKQNTLVLVGGEGGGEGRTATYAKEILLPFSEYFPDTPMLRWAYRYLYQYPLADFVPGTAPQPVLRVRGLVLGPTICSELAYTGKAARQALQADVLVNASSDSWVDSRFYLLQSQNLARVRALEAQKHLIRANNVGPSAFVSPDGSVTDGIFGAPGIADSTVPGRSGQTPYVRLASLLSGG